MDSAQSWPASERDLERARAELDKAERALAEVRRDRTHVTEWDRQRKETEAVKAIRVKQAAIAQLEQAAANVEAAMASARVGAPA